MNRRAWIKSIGQRMRGLWVRVRKLPEGRRQKVRTGTHWLRTDLSELMPLLKEWVHTTSLQSLRESLALDDISSWPRWIKLSTWCAVFALVFSAGLMVLGNGMRQELKAKQSEIEALRVQYAQSLARSTTLPAYRQRVDMMETQFSDMVDVIPSSLEMTQILDQISVASQAGGLRILSFKPGSETRGEGFSVVPVDMRLSGEFHGIGRFLEAVSHMKHLLTVDLQIEPETKSANGQLILTASVKAYRGEPGLGTGLPKTMPPVAADDR